MNLGPAGVTIRVSSGPDGVQAFLVELAVPEWIPSGCEVSQDWPGDLECTWDDPAGSMLIAGVGDIAGVTEICTVYLSNMDYPVDARIETIGPGHHTTLLTSAGLFERRQAFPAIPSFALLDLATVLRGRANTTTRIGLLELVHQLRILEQDMLYGTDQELTLMIRLVDRLGLPDDSQSAVWVLITPAPGVDPGIWPGSELVPAGLWTRCPHYQDGWYGVQFRGSVGNLTVSVSFAGSTYDAFNQTDGNRSRVWGQVAMPGWEDAQGQASAPYATLTLGVPNPSCPWRARFAASILVTYLAQVSGRNTTDSDMIGMTQAIACALGVVPRRVSLSRQGNQLTIQVGVESFLRAYDANLLVLAPTNLQAWLDIANLTLLGVERGAQAYESDPADPPTTCLTGLYFAPSGRFLPLPGHSTAGPDCYGFVCDAGYVPAAHQCAPAFVPDAVFWTVIGLVSSLIVTVTVVSCLLRGLCGRDPDGSLKPDPALIVVEPPPPPPDNTLPVSVTLHGELVFEGVVDEDSCSSSCSSSADENPPELPPEGGY